MFPTRSARFLTYLGLAEFDHAEEQQQNKGHDGRHEEGAATAEIVREEDEQASGVTRSTIGLSAGEDVGAA